MEASIDPGEELARFSYRGAEFRISSTGVFRASGSGWAYVVRSEDEFEERALACLYSLVKTCAIVEGVTDVKTRDMFAKAMDSEAMRSLGFGPSGL